MYGKCTSHISYPSIFSAFRYWVDSYLHVLHEIAKTCNLRSALLSEVNTDISVHWIFRFHGKEIYSTLRYTNILNCSTGDRACQFVFSYNVTDGCDTLLLYFCFLVQYTSQYLGLVPLIMSQEVYYTKLISSSLLLISRLQNDQRKLPRTSYK